MWGGITRYYKRDKELPFTRSLKVFGLVSLSHPSSIVRIFVNSELDIRNVYPTLVPRPCYLLLRYLVVLMPLFFVFFSCFFRNDKVRSVPVLLPSSFVPPMIYT